MSNLMSEMASRVILVLAGVVALFLAQVSVALTFAADYDVGSTSHKLGLALRQRVQKRALGT